MEAERPESFETEETVEKVRSGEGHDDMAGVGEIEGDGEPSRYEGEDVNWRPPGSVIFVESR